MLNLNSFSYPNIISHRQKQSIVWLIIHFCIKISRIQNFYYIYNSIIHIILYIIYFLIYFIIKKQIDYTFTLTLMRRLNIRKIYPEREKLNLINTQYVWAIRSITDTNSWQCSAIRYFCTWMCDILNDIPAFEFVWIDEPWRFWRS